MKRKLAPVHHLWILFGLQFTILVGLLVVFGFLQAQTARWVSQIHQADARMPLLKQRIDQADPERLHKEAVILLDDSVTQSNHVEAMETDVVRVWSGACIVFSIITCWLGIIAFQLNRAYKQSRLLT